MGQARLPLVGVAALAAILAPRPARAFELPGHDIIEASAYRRLLALDQVPGTSVSGRALLAKLIADGVLFVPRCFDPDDPRGVCGADARIETPLAYWPIVRSGAADLIIDRQLNEDGQCQHFMARTDDGLSPVDPRLGVPRALAFDAYDRCTHVLSMVFDVILREPRVANRRLVGMYALMHALEDSFSPAHAERDANGRIVHLMSWTLIDWPHTLGRGTFPPPTHHAVSDRRDHEYLRPGARDGDGRPCGEIPSAYAVPESCLTDRARAAIDAVADLLVVTYTLRARAAARGTVASLSEPEGAEAWKGFVSRHVASAVTPIELRAPDRVAPKRSDVLVGVLGNVRHGGSLGGGLWGGRLFLGPAVPFALGLFGAAGYARDNGSGQVAIGLELGLLLPLVRRFAIGFEPAGVQVACDTGFNHCAASTSATLGQVLIPIGSAAWLGVQGPRWSWDTRALQGSWVGLAFGWAHERAPDARAPATLPAWDPPRPDEVTAYRIARASVLVYVGATAASTVDNQAFGGGLEARRDLDRWDRRSGLAPALGVELAHGVLEGSYGDSLGLLPTLRWYALPNRLAATLVPALVRVGTLAGHATGVDVAGRLGLTVDLGRLEMEVDSPPLSYVSRDRWHTLPFSARLGLLFD